MDPIIRRLLENKKINESEIDSIYSDYQKKYKDYQDANAEVAKYYKLLNNRFRKELVYPTMGSRNSNIPSEVKVEIDQKINADSKYKRLKRELQDASDAYEKAGKNMVSAVSSAKKSGEDVPSEYARVARNFM